MALGLAAGAFLLTAGTAGAYVDPDAVGPAPRVSPYAWLHPADGVRTPLTPELRAAILAGETPDRRAPQDGHEDLSDND